MRSTFYTHLHRACMYGADIKVFSAVFSLCIIVVASIALTGCGGTGKMDPFAGTGSPLYKKTGPIPKGGGRRQIGKPYTVAGNKFYPQADPTYDKTGIGSWYGPKFHKRMTSNGEWFDMDYPSAAHPTLPLPSYAKVTNLANGRQMIVRINDRGPFVGGRVIDLSRKSAEIIDYRHAGTGKVRVQYIGPAPLDDKGVHLAAMNQELTRGTPLNQMIAQASGGGTQVRVASHALSQPAVSAPAVGYGNYFIQIAAYRDQGNAYNTQARLSSLGPVIITPVNASAGTIYRVRMGPLADELAARNALGQVVDAGHHDARLVRVAQY